MGCASSISAYSYPSGGGGDSGDHAEHLQQAAAKARDALRRVKEEEARREQQRLAALAEAQEVARVMGQVGAIVGARNAGPHRNAKDIIQVSSSSTSIIIPSPSDDTSKLNAHSSPHSKYINGSPNPLGRPTIEKVWHTTAAGDAQRMTYRNGQQPSPIVGPPRLNGAANGIGMPSYLYAKRVAADEGFVHTAASAEMAQLSLSNSFESAGTEQLKLRAAQSQRHHSHHLQMMAAQMASAQQQQHQQHQRAGSMPAAVPVVAVPPPAANAYVANVYRTAAPHPHPMAASAPTTANTAATAILGESSSANEHLIDYSNSLVPITFANYDSSPAHQHAAVAPTGPATAPAPAQAAPALRRRAVAVDDPNPLDASLLAPTRCASSPRVLCARSPSFVFPSASNAGSVSSPISRLPLSSFEAVVEGCILSADVAGGVPLREYNGRRSLSEQREQRRQTLIAAAGNSKSGIGIGFASGGGLGSAELRPQRHAPVPSRDASGGADVAMLNSSPAIVHVTTARGGSSQRKATAGPNSSAAEGAEAPTLCGGEASIDAIAQLSATMPGCAIEAVRCSDGVASSAHPSHRSVSLPPTPKVLPCAKTESVPPLGPFNATVGPDGRDGSGFRGGNGATTVRVAGVCSDPFLAQRTAGRGGSPDTELPQIASDGRLTQRKVRDTNEGHATVMASEVPLAPLPSLRRSRSEAPIVPFHAVPIARDDRTRNAASGSGSGSGSGGARARLSIASGSGEGCASEGGAVLSADAFGTEAAPLSGPIGVGEGEGDIIEHLFGVSPTASAVVRRRGVGGGGGGDPMFFSRNGGGGGGGGSDEATRTTSRTSTLKSYLNTNMNNIRSGPQSLSTRDIAAAGANANAKAGIHATPAGVAAFLPSPSQQHLNSPSRCGGCGARGVADASSAAVSAPSWPVVRSDSGIAHLLHGMNMHAAAATSPVGIGPQQRGGSGRMSFQSIAAVTSASASYAERPVAVACGACALR